MHLVTRAGARVAPVACALALVVAGCSSGSSSGTGAASGAAPSSASSVQPGSSSTGGAPTAAGGTLSVSSQQACQAAAQEGGELDYWTSTDTDVFQQEVAPFEQKYDIKIKYTSLRPADMVQRIIAEVQAHHPLDVDAIAGDLPSFAPLFDQKLIQPVDWSALGVPSDLQFTLEGLTVARTYREVLGLGYNTQLVKSSELPDTWEQLIDSKWSGKVIVDPRGIYLSGLSLAWGENQAVAWFKRFLATDKPQIVKGATASMEKVISGEALLTTSSHDSEVAEQQHKGAPVAIKYLDIVPTQDWYAVILKGAAHPNAAACFFSWWIGPDGQAQQQKYEFKTNVTKPPAVPATSKFVSINDPQAAQIATDTASQFAKLMGQG